MFETHTLSAPLHRLHPEKTSLTPQVVRTAEWIVADLVMESLTKRGIVLRQSGYSLGAQKKYGTPILGWERQELDQ